MHGQEYYPQIKVQIDFPTVVLVIDLYVTNYPQT